MIKTRLLLLCALPSLLSLHAQETAGYETNLNLGLSYNSGNTDSSDLNFGFETKNIKEEQEIIIAGLYEYGRQTNTNSEGEDVESTNKDRSKFEAQSNWLLSQVVYSFLNLTAERDEKADIDYRVDAGPGMGYYFFRNDETTLSTEISVVYLVERVAEEDNDYVALRLGQKYEQKIGEGARVWQGFEGVFQFDDSENFYVNVELGIESKLTERLALRAVITDRYNNQPAAGVENNDFSLITGFALDI